MFYLWLVQEAALDFRLVLVTEFWSVPTAVLLLVVGIVCLQRQKASGEADGLALSPEEQRKEWLYRGETQEVGCP